MEYYLNVGMLCKFGVVLFCFRTYYILTFAITYVGTYTIHFLVSQLKLSLISYLIATDIKF